MADHDLPAAPLWARLGLIFTTALVFGALSFGVMATRPPAYRAEGQLVLSLGTSDRRPRTIAQLATSQLVLSEVEGVRATDLSERVSATPVESADVIELSLDASSQEQASAELSSWAEAIQSYTASPGFRQEDPPPIAYFSEKRPSGPIFPRPLQTALIGSLLGVALSSPLLWFRRTVAQTRPQTRDVTSTWG